MDKQGRATKWDELIPGDTYAYCKNGRIGSARMVFLRKAGTWAEFRVASGEVLKTLHWRGGVIAVPESAPESE